MTATRTRHRAARAFPQRIRSPHRTRGRTRSFTVAGQILLLQLAVVALTVAMGAAIALYQYNQQANSQYGQRALAVARSVAALPTVHAALDEPRPAARIQPLAETIRAASDASFVVVANEQQVRYSHPDPHKIGQRLSTDASTVLAGRIWMGTQHGTLGDSVRAKVPIRGAHGSVRGVVSVGILKERVLDYVLQSLMPQFAIFLGIALLLGSAASYLLARRLKRQTLGLEPGDITRLFEESQALLHGVREGLIAVDTEQRITVANDEARRLLALPTDCVGRRVDELDLPSRPVDVLRGRATGDDDIVLRAGRVLVANRMPVTVRGTSTGAVVTLRDRTQLDSLQRELDGARDTTDALRAQAHEFSNQLHTILGLIDLGEHEEAARFITRASNSRETLVATVSEHIRDPALAALIMSKQTAAGERGVQLSLTEHSHVPALDDGDSEVLLTVAGNLVDNAIDALGGDGGWITVDLRTEGTGTLVRVQDSGRGVAPELAGEVFQHGFTTKIAERGGSRGLGLALVRQACVRRGGWVRVHNDGEGEGEGEGDEGTVSDMGAGAVAASTERCGAVFTAFLPHLDASPPVTNTSKRGDAG